MRAIAENKTRNSIDELFEKAITGKQRWLDSFQMIALLPGFKVVDATSYADDRGCDWFVFKSEEWYYPVRSERMHTFVRELPAIISNRGYKEVSTPKDGDVVAYCEQKLGTLDGKHFGIYQGGKVVSKFYDGPVFEHELDAVPHYYGSEIRFFRKGNRLPLPTGQLPVKHI